jgi:hypothetical protein
VIHKLNVRPMHPGIKQHGLASSLVALFLLLLAPCSYPQTSGKKRVTSQSDLPRFTYPVKGSASDLLQSDDATFNAFALKVQADVESTLRDYDIADKATLRLLLQAKLDLQQLGGENQAALETLASLRAEEEKPAARLTTGLFTSAVLRAAIETRSSAGPFSRNPLRGCIRRRLIPCLGRQCKTPSGSNSQTISWSVRPM